MKTVITVSTLILAGIVSAVYAQNQESGLSADEIRTLEEACDDADTCFKSGLAAYDAREYDLAITLMTPACEQNHAKSCNLIGVSEERLGNLESAEEMYTLVCEMTDDWFHTAACYNLGLLVREAGDIERAIDLFDYTCKQGDHGSCYQLGMIEHEDGNVETAVELMKRACAFNRTTMTQGYEDACEQLTTWGIEAPSPRP